MFSGFSGADAAKRPRMSHEAAWTCIFTGCSSWHNLHAMCSGVSADFRDMLVANTVIKTHRRCCFPGQSHENSNQSVFGEHLWGEVWTVTTLWCTKWFLGMILGFSTSSNQWQSWRGVCGPAESFLAEAEPRQWSLYASGTLSCFFLLFICSLFPALCRLSEGTECYCEWHWFKGPFGTITEAALLYLHNQGTASGGAQVLHKWVKNTLLRISWNEPFIFIQQMEAVMDYIKWPCFWDQLNSALSVVSLDFHNWI